LFEVEIGAGRLPTGAAGEPLGAEVRAEVVPFSGDLVLVDVSGSQGGAVVPPRGRDTSKVAGRAVDHVNLALADYGIVIVLAVLDLLHTEQELLSGDRAFRAIFGRGVGPSVENGLRSKSERCVALGGHG